MVKYTTMKKVIITTTLVATFLIPIGVSAQIPFGGKVLYSGECACSGGRLLIVADLFSRVTVPLVFQYGVSRLNQSFNIYTPGTWSLGSYTPGGVCLMGKTSCTPFPVFGTITPRPLPGIGTSLSPSF